MSKQHEAELIPKSQPDAINMAKKKARLMEKKYKNYCRKFGVEKSCHIERDEHGADVSLMSEIVLKLEVDCFPQEIIERKELEIAYEESDSSSLSEYSAHDSESH